MHRSCIHSYKHLFCLNLQATLPTSTIQKNINQIKLCVYNLATVVFHHHHNLFFDTDFDAHAKDIYDEPKWPKEPLFYANFTSVTDTGTAPELPMAAKYTPVGGNVNILRHPPTRQNICCLVYYTLDVHPIVHCIVILIHIYICWIYILLYIVL